MLDPTIYLPQVKSIHIDFDKTFVHKCLKKHNAKYLTHLRWPEAFKALYKEIDNQENKLLHIESVCKKAREESIIPYKAEIWNQIVKHNITKEV